MSQRIDDLKLLLERNEKCRAKHIESAVIREGIDGNVVWEGVVETFQLEGHPAAKRAYAWVVPKEPTRDSPDPEYVYVLGVAPINSARDAVKVSIVDKLRRLLEKAQEIVERKS